MPRDRLLPPDYMARVRANTERMAAEAGLVMRIRDRLINSRLALATAEFARECGAFDAVHRALFKAHWEGTADLDDIADLKSIAAAAGLDAGALGVALADGRYEPLLDAHRADATAVGIDAIPSHIFGRRHLVVGAQPESVFREILAQLEGPPDA